MHEVDGRAVCVFCEDGVPCPAAKKESSLYSLQFPKSAWSRPASNQASADVSLTLTEKQLDDLLVRILFGPIRSMSTAQKIELLLAHAQEG